MSSNFKKGWSFWGRRKKLDHQFNNSFDEGYCSPRIRLQDRFGNPDYSRNNFQTRSLRIDRNQLTFPEDNLSNSMYVTEERRLQQELHKQWQNNLKRDFGYQNIESPHPKPLLQSWQRENELSDNHDGLAPRREYLIGDNSALNHHPGTPNILPLFPPEDQDYDEPQYENIASFKSKTALLPFPEEVESVDITDGFEKPPLLPLPGQNEPMYSELSPRQIQRPPLLPLPNRIFPLWESVQDNVKHIGPHTEEVWHKGGARLNKTIQGICTSMRSFSQRFRKTTKRHYQLDDSPCTPRGTPRASKVTPGKLYSPFDVNTPMTPHSYRRGPKRLQQGHPRRW